MRSVADLSEKAVVPGYLGFIAGPEWRGRVRLVTGLTVADLQAIHEVAGGCGEGIVEAEVPKTLTEARAMLEQVRAERAELAERLQRARDSLRKAAENLNTTNTVMRSLIDHDERAVAALGDVLATFLPDDKGWARSVSVTAEDMDGWSRAAKPWEGV
jgi:hypothetical protein